MVEVKTGAIVMDRTLPGVRVVHDGLLVHGTLVLREVATSRQMGLRALDVATGETMWSRTDLPPLERWSGPLRMAGDTLPFVLESEPSRPGGTKRLDLVTLDVQTGEKLQATVPILESTSAAKLHSDLWIYPGMIVLGTNDGVRGYRTQPWAKTPRGDGGGGSTGRGGS
jgi:hypothetical protein